MCDGRGTNSRKAVVIVELILWGCGGGSEADQSQILGV